MLHVEAKTGVRECDGLTRRDFLRIGTVGAGMAGLTLADMARAGSRARDVNCILLFLVGGPSQLDTWDPKPGAPTNVRGPFQPVRTSVPGVHLAEVFPRMAREAGRYALVRSVHHDAAPIHETGQQLIQTGRLNLSELEGPHYGSVLSALRGPRRPNVPPFVVLPTPLGDTGVAVGHGQSGGELGAGHEPITLQGDPVGGGPWAAFDEARRTLDAADHPGDPARAFALDRILSGETYQALDLTTEPAKLRDRYGRNTFGQSCLLARRLIEAGVRLATVNMFETVFDNVTWDCHADGGSLATTLDDYRRTLCPTFDAAYTALLEDLHQRGMLDSTLVLAAGEFGRTPELNPRGGRDHWPGCWTVLFAGGGVRGGQVIGASDKSAGEPADRPVSPAEIAASVYRALGVRPQTTVVGGNGQPISVCEAAPIAELFGD